MQIKIRELLGREGISDEEIAKMQDNWNMIPVSAQDADDSR